MGEGWEDKYPAERSQRSFTLTQLCSVASSHRPQHLVFLPLPARPWPASMLRPKAGWHPSIRGGGTGTLQGSSSETAAGLEMECDTDGPGGEGFPQPQERALGIYSSWNHLQAHGTLFPASIIPSVPEPAAPSSGKVFLSCHRLK